MLAQVEVERPEGRRGHQGFFRGQAARLERCVQRQLQRPVKIHEAMQCVGAPPMLLECVEELVSVKAECVEVDHDVVSVDVLFEFPVTVSVSDAVIIERERHAYTVDDPTTM